MGTSITGFLKNKLHNPIFLIGLFLKCILCTIIIPDIAYNFYIPFMKLSISHWNFDPWHLWYKFKGNTSAFPYGYVMWFAFLPFYLIASLLDYSTYIPYVLLLLFIDIGMLYLLEKILNIRDFQANFIYWFSPIVIIATYVLGYNDLVPVLLLFIAIYALKNLKFYLAGFMLICAISAKLSMVIALPFFVIYLFNHRVLRKKLLDFTIGALLASVLFILPFLFSVSGREMISNNPEMYKIYQYSFTFDNAHQLFILPLCYLIMLYSAWRIQRMNFDMFFSMLGLVFLLVVLLVPTAPGWFVWVAPFLVMFQLSMGKTGKILVGLFVVFYCLDVFILMPGFELRGFDTGIKCMINLRNNPYISSLLITITMALGMVLWASVWQAKIIKNNFFRVSRKPFSIGIAGDSGSGKDTYANALIDIFGQQSVVSLSGDDYHCWDRHGPMWQVMTHLNPFANNLQSFVNDLFLLMSGKGIYKRHYNHISGKMSRPEYLKSNDIIIASGLHALYLPILRSSYNLSVFLDIDENLRRFFKLDRDTKQRGHSIQQVLSNFVRREPDAEKFIKPQKAHSDLVFSLIPANEKKLLNDRELDSLKLKVIFLNQFNEQEIIRILVGLLGLNVDLNINEHTSKVEMVIDGDVFAEDVALAAKILCPNILEFLDLNPYWKPGMLGMMQLITLSHINQSFMKRFI